MKKIVATINNPSALPKDSHWLRLIDGIESITFNTTVRSAVETMTDLGYDCEDYDLSLNVNPLLKFMAQACYYAQSHIADPQAWSDKELERGNYLQCTSYQVACFLAQNTVEGINGVDSEIIIEELVSTKLDDNGLMLKDWEDWEVLLQKLVDDHGGWK